MRILLVDNDEIIIDLLQRNLRKQNYAIDAVTDGEQAWVYGSTYTYDLIILGWSLPKLDGISLCQRFRAQGYHLPILLLTERNSSQDKIKGLDAGADDYLCKPFDLGELAARLRALLRRSNSNSLPVLSWGDLQLDPGSCQVTYRGDLLLLTAKEYQLLELFLRHSQEVFSIEEIIDTLWSSVEYPAEATVRSHLRRLRHKLKQAGLPDDPIETLRGRGYCLKSQPQNGNSTAILLPLPLGSQEHRCREVALEGNHPCQVRERCPLLLIVDRDAAFAELLTQEAIARGIRTVLVPTPELARTWLKDLQQEQLPHAVLLRLSLAPGTSNLLSLEEQLSLIAEFNLLVPPVRAIAIAEGDGFPERLLVARRGGAFLLKLPVTPARAIAFCQQVLERSSQGKKVMVVDDDVELLRSLPSLLQPWGFKLTTLDDPRKFWEVLQAVDPHLLVLDLEMPYLSGMELCKVLRTHPYWYSLPVLYLTAHRDGDIPDEVLASGADGFVYKPFVAERLGDRILHHLERTPLSQSQR